MTEALSNQQIARELDISEADREDSHINTHRQVRHARPSGSHGENDMRWTGLIS
ncbi:hypothetical protein [Actinomyces johnsonii]|uniref:hypothetical protein n=1 Tax=Actinomyces johnsonii TaxID=544581 RepID=UPI0009DBE416|nr:hypothetical protein [Actinomyces johnsonii]